MALPIEDTLFRRFRDEGDLDALAALFDRLAPRLERLGARLSGGDADRAQDLVQETFLQAIRHRERWDETRPVLPWLVGILGNHAREARRHTATRRTPEELAANLLERTAPDPAEAARQAELGLEVRNAIASLPPTLRSVVQGKLVEQADSSTLARELGLSAGALRVRLHRGLQLLRGLLPQGIATALALAGLRSSGLADVRTRILSEGGAVATGRLASGGLGLGGLLLGRAVLATVVIALSVLAVGTGLRWWTTPAPAGSAAASVSTPATARAADPPGARPQRVEQRRTTSQVASGSAGAPWRVTAQVIDPQGEPVYGTVVELHMTAVDVAELTARTDEEGLARFEPPRAARLRQLVVAVGAEHVGASLYLRDVGSTSGDVERTLVAGPGGTVEGVVLDEHDLPVAAAEVFGWCGSSKRGEAHRTVRADAAGRFTVPHLGADFVLEARSATLVAAVGLRGTIADGSLLDGFELRVARPVTLRGRVVDPAGRPLGAAQASTSDTLNSRSSRDATHVPEVLTFRAGSGAAVTTEDGRFEIAGLPPQNHQLTVGRPPFNTYAEWHDPSDGDVVVRMDPGLRLGGRVFDADGRPAQGARVRFWPFYSNRQTVPEFVETDAEGAFELIGLNRPSEWGPDPSGIAVEHDGHAVLVVQPIAPSEDGGERLRLQLERERRVEGLVVDGDGNPLADVLVRVQGDRGYDSGYSDGTPFTWERAIRASHQRTDEAGRFAFGHLYDGTFEVFAYEGNAQTPYVSQTVELDARYDQAELRLVASQEALRKVVLRGRVIAAEDGKPIRAFALGTGTDRWLSFQEIWDADGRFELTGLTPGSRNVEIRARGFAPSKIEGRAFELGEHELLFELRAERRLQLRVRDSNGKPVQRGAVEGRDASGRPIPFVTGPGSTSTRIDFRDGEAALGGLPAERVTLEIWSDLTPQLVEVDLTLPHEGVLDVTDSPMEETWLPLAIAESDGSVDEAEAVRMWQRALERDREAGAWLFERFESGQLRPLTGAVRLTASTPDVSEIARGLLERKGDVILLETWTRRLTGGMGSSHEISLEGGRPPIVDVSLEVPVGPIELRIASDDYQARLLHLQALAESATVQPTLILLER